MRKHNYLVLALALGLCGCEPQTQTENLTVTPKVAAPTNQVERVELFTVMSKGTFKAGYDDTVREIFILRDNKTGVEYLGITDCTLIKRIQTKKAEAAEEAMDAALDVLDVVLE